MKKKIFLYLVIIFWNLSINAKVKEEHLTYTSYTTDSFSQIFDESYVKQDSIKHKVPVWLHKKRKGPFPVIVMQHGIGSPKNYNKWLKIAIPRYLSEGFAVIMNDSYSARKMKNPKRLSFSSRVLDNILLFNKIYHDNRFDRKNINILGFSYGGMVAYHMAYEAYKPFLYGTWNSHLSMYGACDIILEDNKMTGSPVLMYLASGEDRQLNDDCFKYKALIGGFSISVLENSFHGFAMDDEVQKKGKEGLFTKCDTGPQNQITKDGTWRYNNKNWSGPYNEIMSSIWRDCGHFGEVVFGGSSKVRSQAVEDSILFFKQAVTE